MNLSFLLFLAFKLLLALGENILSIEVLLGFGSEILIFY